MLSCANFQWDEVDILGQRIRSKVSRSVLTEQFLIRFSQVILCATVLRLNKDCGWGEVLILMARMVADSQELFISISNSNSFPRTHWVTSKEGVRGV